MLNCELDVMEYAVTMESALLDSNIITMSDIEADTFIDWLYDDFNDMFDISESELYKLCNSNIDADTNTLTLTIFDDNFNQVFQGLALDYPYDWYDCHIDDYHIYNVNNNVYIDVWAHFDTWR